MDQLEAIRKMAELNAIEKELLFYTELAQYARDKVQEIVVRLEEMDLEIKA